MRNVDKKLSQYAAFISYSHADAVIARRLHRALERYVVPAKYRTLLPVAKARKFSPVCRDEDEFASSPDLGFAIRSALDNSRSLVVVSTESSAKSRWVDEEISHFCDRGSQRGIVAALYKSGEVSPQLSDKAIAIDLRNRARPSQKSISSIVAALLGVDSADFLRKRRAEVFRRSLWRATWITFLVSAVLFIAIVLLLTGALTAWDELGTVFDRRLYVLDRVVCAKAPQLSENAAALQNRSVTAQHDDASDIRHYADDMTVACKRLDDMKLAKRSHQQ